MTHKDSPQDFDPKHRILGAVIIVALAVIFVPLVLRERSTVPVTENPENARTSSASGAENRVVVTEVPPPGTATKPATSVPVAPVAEPTKTVTVELKPAAVEPKPAPAAEPKPVAEPKTAPAPSTGWVVQVGTFANAANASRLEQKLRAEGQPVRADQIQLETGKAVRLRVGPFRDRAGALKAQERIQKELGVKGVVLAYP
ncbi:MAG: SPOR domain-containing protein [Sulfurifustis sp.]